MIQDNILIVQEMRHQLRVRKRKKNFQAFLKFDMQKPYDRVEWNFLKANMLKMRFCSKWVNWIIQYVFAVTFSVKINCESQPFFQPTRGIR